MRDTVAAIPLLVGEVCDCDWMGDVDCIQPCAGCGDDVRLYRDHVRHFGGPRAWDGLSLHYHAECAYRAAVIKAIEDGS